MTYEDNAFEIGLDRLVDFDTVTDDACISIAACRRIKATPASPSASSASSSTATRSRPSTT